MARSKEEIEAFLIQLKEWYKAEFGREWESTKMHLYFVEMGHEAHRRFLERRCGHLTYIEPRSGQVKCEDLISLLEEHRKQAYSDFDKQKVGFDELKIKDTTTIVDDVDNTGWTLDDAKPIIQKRKRGRPPKKQV